MASIKALNLAAELSASLERRTRNNGDKFVCLKDGSPEWVTDVIHTAHGDSLPNDTIYSMIEKNADALTNVEESDADEAWVAIAEIEAPIYNAELTGWLAESLDHIDYVDQAIEEYGDMGSGGIVSLLAMGWKKQQEEVGGLLLEALEAEAEKQTEE
jgi:hypothetical protein